MEKVSFTVQLKKPRNPLYKELAMLGKRVVKSKKGRGSYSRKGRDRNNSF